MAARDFEQNRLKPGVIERDEQQKFPAEFVKEFELFDNSRAAHQRNRPLAQFKTSENLSANRSLPIVNFYPSLCRCSLLP